MRLEEEMGMFKTMLLDERMARVELEQRIEANGGVVPPPPPSSLAMESAASAGQVAGASNRLLGGIRRLQRKDSWGRKAGSPSPPGGPVRHNEGDRGKPNAATSFLKGMTSGLGALANDLADAALGTDPALAARAAAPAAPPRTPVRAPSTPSPPLYAAPVTDTYQPPMPPPLSPMPPPGTPPLLASPLPSSIPLPLSPMPPPAPLAQPLSPLPHPLVPLPLSPSPRAPDEDGEQ
ncbi:hypothetical protein T492DRAFT_299906 [Pavlovales sp. CCMP2436]|nr:hypothetical protein T492DRAFT_299906 [Pavlovales sp. CCMP2436]